MSDQADPKPVPPEPHVRYEPIEDVEPFGRYGPGGYYPMQIGDQFCSSRYRIIHKLGHGSSSTIWLARDERLSRYVAMKIAMSRLDGPLKESAILQKLRDAAGSDLAQPGAATIPELLDEFVLEGPEIQ
ncbi:hypothetical protein NX059_007863, partial [Plenodomus lindquistii]